MDKRDKNERRLQLRVGLVSVLVGFFGASAVAPPPQFMVWNMSPSAPVGLYALGPIGGIRAGDMVVAHVPKPWRELAAARHYLPANVPLVKRAAAVPGDKVCAFSDHIYVNGRRLASRRSHDGAGRDMPAWHGCVTLDDRTFFLLMAGNEDSFDGRYFGPTGAADIVGKATPVWTR